ncbi:SDR family oxidoreductase [Simiduia sp. 21SJ11W-1]|uniref:SDR family NAD(P)-dependent oxidoreductase n=1 Tax=Simiduia sp. 21SJ11W-1 TaxID=2909669 RepID=UPI0020A15B98|nr:SDR family oxidoreductase [Simiduia sp. 21SJ11W-1]UTA47319.1 SDR family oxidoreductase [Simiduia sp. 21SJ11W-1]
MDKLLDFTDKTIIITGAAQGFGALLAKELAARGANLVLGDIKTEPLQALAGELKALGTKVIAQACDVGNETHCKAMVTAALDTFGQLDIAVNNAGIAHPLGPIETLSNEAFDKQWQVNVMGVQFGLRHQIAAMRKQKSGVILNVASMAGLGAAPLGGAYSAAKHAVVGLTKTAAYEVAADNIRINAICPFFTATPMVTESDMVSMAGGLEKAKATLARGAPMRRIAEPIEVVNAMLLLLSPGNTFMTGQAIAVDGGLSSM